MHERSANPTPHTHQQAPLLHSPPPPLQGGSLSGYKAGYGYGGGETPPPVPGSNTLQAAADGGALRDRSNDTCYKCNGTGHWASSCEINSAALLPRLPAVGAEFVEALVCLIVLLLVHPPQPGPRGNPAPEGPNQGGGDAGGGGGTKTGSCFKCGQDGHWSRRVSARCAALPCCLLAHRQELRPCLSDGC